MVGHLPGAGGLANRYPTPKPVPGSVSSRSVVAPGDDFDDIPEDTLAGPLLPPEDRLWRHPSELGQSGQSVRAEALSARRSWMAATPSRAGAWSAGAVRAEIATGVVLVGGHLTPLLSPSAPKFSVTSIPAGGTRANL